MGEDTIQTPDGELRATALNELQSTFDTRHLLRFWCKSRSGSA